MHQRTTGHRTALHSTGAAGLALLCLGGCTRRGEIDAHLDAVAGPLVATVAESRALFLGSRRLDGTSCVTPVPTGTLGDNQQPPPRAKWKDGGCATFFVLPKANDPVTHYELLQTRLRADLQGRLARARAAQPRADLLAAEADRLARAVAALPAVEPVTAPVPVWPAKGPVPGLDQSRPARTFALLGERLGAGDLPRAQVEALELAGTCAHLADLHRWLVLVYENFLAALDFQTQSREFFAATLKDFAKDPYDSSWSPGRFPGGSLILYGEHNLYEIERQAEGIFASPPQRAGRRPKQTAKKTKEKEIVPAAYAVPPELRGAFAYLRSALSAKNQAAYDRAATAPYHRACLHNMLFRIRAANTLDRAVTVLRRLDARRTEATPGDILDALSYRGGGFFCGLEWGDRFDPRLMAAAENLGGDARELLKAAAGFTHSRYDEKLYRGGTLTLRSALDTRTFDCIRATDMVGAVFRDAGAGGFFEVRACRLAPPSHTVAGVRAQPGAARFIVRDGLLPPAQQERTWPEDWFADEKDYCVEVYCRGLDTSLWLGGYVVRGPKAGFLTTAPMPWLEGFAAPRHEQVFRGPFPGPTRGSAR